MLKLLLAILFYVGEGACDALVGFMARMGFIACVSTWSAASQAVAYASAKKLIDVFNSSSSAKTIKVYLIIWLNNGTGAVTGVLTALTINRTSAASAGTTITPTAMNLGDTALDANTTAGTNRTVTAGAVFRQVLYQNDEPTVTTLDMDAMLTLVPYGTLWSVGYGDSNVEPITCRASNNEGVCLLQPGANAVGTGDGEMIFTNA